MVTLGADAPARLRGAAGPAPLSRVSFAVRVTPRGGADRVDGVGPEGELLVHVRAAPADGAANAGLIRVIAEAFEVAPSRVRIERGATSRRKRIVVEDVDPAVITQRWPGLRTRTERGR